MKMYLYCHLWASVCRLTFIKPCDVIIIIIIIIQEFMYSDTTNVEPEMLDYTSNNWSHRNSNKRFKEKFGSHTRNTFN